MRKSDNNKRILAQNDYNKRNVLYIVLMSWPGLCECDKIKRMITFAVITLSGFHCTILLNCMSFRQIFCWFAAQKHDQWKDLCCVFWPAFGCLHTPKLVEILILGILHHSFFVFTRKRAKQMLKCWKKYVFLAFGSLLFKAGWHPNAGWLPEGYPKKLKLKSPRKTFKIDADKII